MARLLAAQVSQPSLAEELTATPGEGIEGAVEGQRYRIGKFEYALGHARQDDQVGAYSVAVLATADGQPLAEFWLSDQVRIDASESIRALQAAGLRVEMLSGDRPEVAGQVAEEIGIQHWQAGLSPEQKLTAIKALQAEGAVVAMVGDGVNDAPVLAGAQVSVAMGSGTNWPRPAPIWCYYRDSSCIWRRPARWPYEREG